MKRFLRIVLLTTTLLALLSQALVAFGQDEGEATLSLRFRRDFGYSLGPQMQGRFTITAEGPEDLTRVDFLLDDQVIAEDKEAPFSLAFDTSAYSEGLHHFSALGFRANGQQLKSEVISRQFVSSNMVIIVVVVVVVLVIVVRIATQLLSRRSGGKKAGYGFLGGAVCPRCGHPFSIHWWSLRLGFGRFDRCPHCGKWHMAHRASAEALQAAEESFTEKGDSADKGDSEGKDEEFQRLLDESKYDQG